MKLDTNGTWGIFANTSCFPALGKVAIAKGQAAIDMQRSNS